MFAEGTAPCSRCIAVFGRRVLSRGTSIALPVEYSRCTRSMSSSVVFMVSSCSTWDSRRRSAIGVRTLFRVLRGQVSFAHATCPLFHRKRVLTLWKRGDGRLLAAIDRLGVRAGDGVVHFLEAARGHLEHEEELALLDVLLEALQARVGHLQPHHARHPRAERGAA